MKIETGNQILITALLIYILYIYHCTFFLMSEINWLSNSWSTVVYCLKPSTFPFQSSQGSDHCPCLCLIDTCLERKTNLFIQQRKGLACSLYIRPLANPPAGPSQLTPRREASCWVGVRSLRDSHRKPSHNTRLSLKRTHKTNACKQHRLNRGS